MSGTLYVLQFKSPGSARILGQRVTFDELPENWKCFNARDEHGRPWKSARVELEPKEHRPREVFFATRDTGYMLVLERS